MGKNMLSVDNSTGIKDKLYDNLINVVFTKTEEELLIVAGDLN